MTPGEAIRKHCIECVGSVYETKNCGGNYLLGTDKPCPLYPFRQGEGRPSVKVIRKECLSCMNGGSDMVRHCPSESCKLYQFRFGKNPNFQLSDAERKRRVERLSEFVEKR